MTTRRRRRTTTNAGLDWAKDEQHALCILDEEVGRILLEGRFAHDERGLAELRRASPSFAELRRSLVANDVQAVAIERPEGGFGRGPA